MKKQKYYDTLYRDLKTAGTRFLKGLREDYEYFYTGVHKTKSLAMIDKILNERKVNDED